MTKKIRIIYSKNPDEIFNRKAALGSYIYVLGGLLQEHGYSVSINEHAYTAIKQHTSSGTNAAGNQSLIKRMIPSFVKRIVKDIFLFRRLDSLTKKLIGFQDDLILEFYSYGSTVGYELAVKNNVPLIVIYDAPVIDEYKFFNGVTPFLMKKVNRKEKKTLLKATSTVVYSNAVKNYVWKKIGKQTPIRLHQNIDFTRFDFIDQPHSGSPINIGFIGSFLKWHRVDLLLKVFTRLKSEHYNIKLYLLGMGEEFTTIKEACANNTYKNDIVLPGFVDGEELLGFKKNIHIGVMPGSNWYGAPNKIFEYGAAHMAVIAPDTPTITDLFVNKKEVYLFENNSENALYQGLKELVSNAEFTTLLAENLYQKIRANYSKTNTFDFYNRLIKEAIQ